VPQIRVLVVDDSSVVRRVVAGILSADPQISVVGSAPNGRVALARIEEAPPDLVVLDLEMPEMDGLHMLEELRKTHPRLPVVVFSTLTHRGAIATLDALALGATDYVTKPTSVSTAGGDVAGVGATLLEKVKTFGLAAAHARSSTRVAAANASSEAAAAQGRSVARRIDVVAIGVSTGGPNALAIVLPSLPAGFSVPVLVVQHMPPLFTKLLAERLASACALRVREGIDGARLEPGDVWIAPGDFHMKVRRDPAGARIEIDRSPPENSCRPAVDVLFRSAAGAFGAGTLGVVLTGMGRDGSRGSTAIAGAGGRVVVQDEATSTVWGMPGAIAESGIADAVLPLPAIGPDIVRRVAQSRSLPPAAPPDERVVG
jgi:two-component system, chemotaxis family, protein-glutamate methylesterase/glutaminase